MKGDTNVKTIEICVECRRSDYEEELEFWKKMEVEENADLKNILDCEVMQFAVWGFEGICATIYDINGNIILDY